MSIRARTSASRGLAPAALASCLALLCCGGGEDSEFPSLATAYGTGEWVGEDGRFQQTYTMNDGEIEQFTVTGRITIDSQSAGTWTGTVFRCESRPTSWCYSTGRMAGTIGPDRTLRFTLTQERWKGCTALAPGEYSGLSEASTFFATGATPLRCEDGREGKVEESIWLKAAAPPGYRPL